jgi:hypothetical protein
LRQHTAAAGCPHISRLCPNTTCAACSVTNEQRTSRNHPAEATHMRSSGRAPTITKRIKNRLLVRVSRHIVRDLFQLEGACGRLVRVVRFFPPRDRHHEDESEGQEQPCTPEDANISIILEPRYAMYDGADYRQRCRAAQCATIAIPIPRKPGVVVQLRRMERMLFQT